MNDTDDLERGLRSWMASEAEDQLPEPLYHAILDRSRAVRQRGRRWFAPGLAQRHFGTAGGATRSAARLLLVAALLVAVIGAALVVGSRLMPVTPSVRIPTGLFQPTGQMQAASDLQRPAVTLLDDGRVLIAGGDPEGDPATAVIFDPATGTYGETIHMEASRWGATATVLRDGRVLVTGGTDPSNSRVQSRAELFDPRQGTFALSGSMVDGREAHTATLLPDGQVLIVGGSVDRESSPGSQSFEADPIASAEVYDPATGVFTAVGSLATGRRGHTATLLPDGTVLVTGGYGRAAGGTYEATASAELFDPATGSFRPTGAMATARAGHSATLLPDGTVLVVGGGTSFDPDGYASGVATSSEIYDPHAGAFTPTGSMLTERTEHSATLLPEGRVLVAGGYNDRGDPLTAELFDPRSGTFVAGGQATGAHRFGVAPLLADGRVFLPDSWHSEIYEPGGQLSASTSTPHASPSDTTGSDPFLALPMTTQRVAHTAAILPDGRVLVAGGIGGRDVAGLASAELFDPSNDTFVPTGSMRVPRSGAVAVPLADGRVLMVGGDFSDAESAERYDPATGSFTPATSGGLSAVRDARVVSVPGLPSDTLLVERYVPSTATTAARHILTVMDAKEGDALASTDLCGSGQSVGSPAAWLRDGRVLILCGPEGPAELFDPATGARASAGIRGDWVTALPLSDGRIALLSAPEDGTDGTSILRVSGLFDPANGALQVVPTAPSTESPSQRHVDELGSMVELQDGRLLLVGGFDGASDRARLFDPASATSRDIGPFLAPREQPSVTLLGDGRILIVGGATQPPDRTDPVPPAAELFDPRLAP